MHFNKHYDLVGRHAFLSPSKYHWIYYDEEKLVTTYMNSVAAKRGSDLHDLARRCIELKKKLPKTKDTFNQFVNDAIGFRMSPEQVLFYSYYAFGTADAISYRQRMLRIHDLKTGRGRVTMEQLEIYAALFCLEYNIKPSSIDMELRIYQSNIITHKPDPPEIRRIMEKIKFFDKKIKELNSEEDVVWLEL